MKFKKFITSIILFFFFMMINANAKILPPGTGTQADVPSNLLILLDKSGSMGWRMRSSQSMERMRHNYRQLRKYLFCSIFKSGN